MDVVVSMLKQSRVQAALEYAHKQASFTPKDYMRLLQACRSQQLAQALVAPGRQLLPLGTVIRVLLDTSYEESKGLQLLVDLHSNSAGELSSCQVVLSLKMKSWYFGESVTAKLHTRTMNEPLPSQAMRITIATGPTSKQLEINSCIIILSGFLQ